MAQSPDFMFLFTISPPLGSQDPLEMVCIENSGNCTCFCKSIYLAKVFEDAALNPATIALWSAFWDSYRPETSWAVFCCKTVWNMMMITIYFKYFKFQFVQVFNFHTLTIGSVDKLRILSHASLLLPAARKCPPTALRPTLQMVLQRNIF